ncbi:hypothetical protein [Actinoplanes couchii]|uniref:Uncharacterized protein n=1 Tax=Actinoplanes couchii TaxID=403638 RepID=A0ABQ3X7M6_9ACTN|nr:hypothetical protein [Actinoplanes couchii]MDR6322344.1 hypothetical protein [Actinoplanes couchii]GID54502.1 hypothetical protein Aco03nite_029060 [Actinoplanes couchii]
MTVDALVTTIVTRLAGQGRVVPEYVVRDAVEVTLRRRVPDQTVVPPAVAAELISGFCDGPADPGDDTDDTMPAVLSGDETGHVVTALGLAVHVAAFNLDRDRLHVAQILNGAAAALVALGGASRAAHSDGTAAVLVSPATLRTVRATVGEVLQGLRERGWQARHLDQDAMTTLFGGVLDLIRV